MLNVLVFLYQYVAEFLSANAVTLICSGVGLAWATVGLSHVLDECPNFAEGIIIN